MAPRKQIRAPPLTDSEEDQPTQEDPGAQKETKMENPEHEPTISDEQLFQESILLTSESEKELEEDIPLVIDEDQALASDDQQEDSDKTPTKDEGSKSDSTDQDGLTMVMKDTTRK